VNLRNPTFWARIGAIVGFLFAYGGFDWWFLDLLDGVVGAFLQYFIWYGISWVIINKRLPRRLPNRLTKQLPLYAWFFIVYFLNALGPLLRSLVSAPSQLQRDFILRDTFSTAGFINTFLFPSLALAITITSTIFAYRRVKGKLKNQKRRFLLVLFFIFSATVVWILISFGLAVLFQ
jgi:hypothetical protein